MMAANSASTTAASPMSFEQESRLLLWLRTTTAGHLIGTMLTQARLRVVLVVLLSFIFWASLFGIFFEAFTFIDSMHAEVISLLFNVFFSSLMVMMVFSTGILMYGGLYTSDEAKLLLTFPLRPEAIHAHKFQEALWFSSWGFVLLGSPMLVSYGIVRDAPWTFFVMLLPFMVSFVVIPATVGSILCMLIVAGLPRLRVHAISISIGIVSLGLIWTVWTTLQSTQSETMTVAWFEETLSRLSMTEQMALPSWWLSSGLLDSSMRGETPEQAWASTVESMKFLGLLIANALLLNLIAGWVARWCYRAGYSHLQAEIPQRRQHKISWLDNLLAHSGPRWGSPLRLLLVKDLQIFRRDATQWSQFMIFFGLLGLYFFNLKSFNYSHAYASIIGYLNLAVVGLILSTFTTRFVFPSISLEGRRFWILGLLPVSRDHIVWSKFLFAFSGGLLPCLGLVVLSDSMLNVPRNTMLIHLFCCSMLCSGLSGIAVGLGACMPDLRESSPAKIAAGFGGTLSLVLSALFIIAVVMTTALPSHLNLLRRSMGQMPDENFLGFVSSGFGIVTSLGIVVVLGLAATFVPLVFGVRAFRRLEP
jgi:ABC-2 type transport system permease protein